MGSLITRLNTASRVCCALTLLAFPYAPRLVVVFLALYMALSIPGVQRRRIFLPRMQLLLWSAIAFWSFHALSLLWSDNTVYGFRDLETKLAFLLVPVGALIFPRTGEEKMDFRRFITISAAVSIVVCFFHSLYLYSEKLDIGSFFYDKFSFFMHPTYFTMFLNLALLVHLAGDPEPGSDNKPVPDLFAAFLISGVVLTSSRAGMVIALLTSSSLLIMRWKEQREGKLLRRLGFVVATYITIFLFSFLVNPASRFGIVIREVTGTQMPAGVVDEKKVDVNPVSHRKILWNVAWNLCREHPLGVGCGDVQDVLVEAYAKIGFEKAVLVRYNPHNQFLQTCLSLGIPGLILLVLMVVPLFPARSDRLLLNSLCVVFILNGMFESVFEVQRGVLAYALVLLFMTGTEDEPGYDNQRITGSQGIG